MDEKLQQVIKMVHELRNEAVKKKSKAMANLDTYSLYLSKGKYMAYSELLIEIENILNP